MTIKLLSVAAALALCPAALLAQQTSPKATSTASSSGEVSENVSPKAVQEQKDPNLVGSPAWWSTHATADGKPLSAEGTRAKEQKKPS